MKPETLEFSLQPLIERLKKVEVEANRLGKTVTMIETNVTDVLTDCDKDGNLCVGIMTKEDAKYAEILKQKQHQDEVIENLRKSVDLHQQETHNILNSREYKTGKALWDAVTNNLSRYVKMSDKERQVALSGTDGQIFLQKLLAIAATQI